MTMMHFAAPLPWWLTLLVAAGIAGVAFLSYRRTLVPLSAAQRGTLIALRVLALGTVVFFLCRPIRLMPPAADGGAIVPVLVDVSRSMRVADADGETRIARAADLLQTALLPAIGQQGKS